MANMQTKWNWYRGTAMERSTEITETSFQASYISQKKKEKKKKKKITVTWVKVT